MAVVATPLILHIYVFLCLRRLYYGCTDAVGTVSNIEIGDDWLSFETDAVGVPHLVKVSYFPNWVADGAEGPYRAAPSLMVVVPTSERVEMRFGRSWIEFVGFGATLLAIAGLVSTRYVPSVRRRLGAAELGDRTAGSETVSV